MSGRGLYPRCDVKGCKRKATIGLLCALHSAILRADPFVPKRETEIVPFDPAIEEAIQEAKAQTT